MQYSYKLLVTKDELNPIQINQNTRLLFIENNKLYGIFGALDSPYLHHEGSNLNQKYRRITASRIEYPCNLESEIIEILNSFSFKFQIFIRTQHVV